MAGEQKLQQACKKHAESLGCLVRKIKYDGRRDCPDLLIVLPSGNVLFVELKNPNKNGKLSKGQEREIELLRSYDLRVYVVDDFEQFKTLLEKRLNA